MGGTCAVWCCLASCLDCHVFSLFCVFFTPFSRERACGASHGVDTMRCECDNDWRAGGNGHLQSAFFVLSCFSDASSSSSSGGAKEAQQEQMGPVLAGPGALKAAPPLIGFGLMKLTPEQLEMVTRAKKFAMEQSIKSVLMKQTIAHQQQKTLQRHQALVLMCRVFEAFGKIRSCKLIPSSTPGKHKEYGFIEYETNVGANEAIASMNLFDLGGQYLRVGRAITPPNALTPPSAQSCMPTAAAVAAAAATAKIQAMDAVANNALALGLSSPGAIRSSSAAALGLSSPGVIGSSPAAAVIPPPGLTIPTLVPPGLVGPPGVLPQPVLAANAPGIITGVTPMPPTAALIPPPTIVTTLPMSAPKPDLLNAAAAALVTTTTAVETVMSQATFSQTALSQAVLSQAVLNQAVLNQAVLKQGNQVPAANAAAVPGDTPKEDDDLAKKIAEELEPQTLQQQENMMIKGSNARHMLMRKLMRRTESCVVVLRNMVGVEDLDDELESEVTDECGRFGTVKRVIIYQERQSEDDNAEIVVKIFVEFSQAQEAASARDALNGRFFGGRLVKAELYDQTLYEANDLSG
ncbi:poly(U)-binding-splicing factor PUF60 isoform X10 [Dermacentor andersoni]|uniref:poly(U)-binding-splicing factor PUF60 isoform X10 n=1 Tax=Dermacentor andersoni TaxID=34620 RepID=UPI002415F559|nr:poly(U)-binding-splicing factor PUF60-B-like isoform X11 [Dermacentor andersoni]